jgi:hypothetical protein
VFDAKQMGITQLQKLHDRSAVQLTMAPVLACMQRHSSAASGGGGGNAAAAQQRRTVGVAGALRNITNEQQSATSVSRTGVMSNVAQDRRAPSSDDTVMKPAGGRPRPPGTQLSTLAHLTALNAANQPLPSHQQKRFGMAATQQRNTQMQMQQQQQQQAAALPRPSAIPAAQSARKRKVAQNL